jgi:prepilin-type processing-associated H-X9-DG protein
MVDKGFQVDPAKLARHAGEFPGYADRMSAIHGELSTALDRTGQCWGADAAGQSFADGHVAPSAGTLDQLGAMPGRLHDVGDRFRTTATTYQQGDEYAAGLLPTNE